MIRCTRGPAPEPLVTHGARWTHELVRRREADPRCEFRWPTHHGRPLNQHLQEPLGAMTAGHCAYCDAFPLDASGFPTIDHFRPWSRFPDLGCTWDNLFLACSRCQGEKRDRWADELLRPDDPDYGFERYFLYDHITGRVEVNPAASDADRARASRAIEVFGLNAGGRTTDRKRWARRWRRTDEDLDDRPYRFVT